MRSSLDKLVTFVTEDDSIDFAIRKMSNESREVTFPGICVVLSREGAHVVGVLTDGDIRRGYSKNILYSAPVNSLMSRNPVFVPDGIKASDIPQAVTQQLKNSTKHHSKFVKYVLVLDGNHNLIDIVDCEYLLHSFDAASQGVAVIGMGYVGLTLAASLANVGHKVYGVEVNDKIVDDLGHGVLHIHEPGLMELVELNIKKNQLNFITKINEESIQTYIISVGTPLKLDGEPDFSPILNVCDQLGHKLKVGDHVMLRSTVPAGTTRKIVIPKLELISGLKAGIDFHVSFVPERTIEGKALIELRSLPQVIGSYTVNCANHAANFWACLTSSIVRVQSLEMAELIKLANNTFRDLSFAFANELALVADRFNIDSNALVHAANDGYMRNQIPYPSPGVGGYCLTKDPVLFGYIADQKRADEVLGSAGRRINQMAANYPITVIKKYAQESSKKINDLKILIVGIAFKGMPETTDVRGSIALDVIAGLRLIEMHNVYVWDAIIGKVKLEELGLNTLLDISTEIDEMDVVLVLNNHEKNTLPEVYKGSKRGRLLFDGWGQFRADQIEKVEGLKYSTMGYMTL